MAQTYKVLSALLCYPTAEFQAAARDLIVAINAEHLLPAQKKAEIVSLIDRIADSDLIDVQSAYVDLFDRTRGLSLHLFEHVHGESRDRGQAMVSLRERYLQAGFEIASNELPDYLPMFLEFLSTCPARQAGTLLGEPLHIVVALGERLLKRKSPYAVVFDALAALAAATPDEAALAEIRERELDDPDDLAALDQAWEEAQVRFGPGDMPQDGCPKVNALLRRPLPASPALRTSEPGAKP